MNKFERPEDISKIKKQIHEEGFEENAAVLIGKKEEMPELLEKLEKEGRAENLGSYIKMHKEISLPFDEISDENLKKELKENKSNFVLMFTVKSKGELLYIDKNSNIARVNLDIDKIADIDKKNKNEKLTGPLITEKIVRNELTKIGFSDSLLYNEVKENQEKEKQKLNLEIWGKVKKEIAAHKKRLEEKELERKKEEFDF